MRLKDCLGKEIRTGCIVAYKKHRGIVVADEFEGQFVVFKDRLKIRVKDYASRLRVVNPGKSKIVEGGLIVDGTRRF